MSMEGIILNQTFPEKLMRKLAFFTIYFTICWFGMELIHEMGHVFAAWFSGATVERVVLWPISRTDTADVQFPLWVYGSGPVFGAIFPVMVWGISVLFRFKHAYLFRFFAGFCLIANGAYIGCDFSKIGPTDAGLLIQHGAPRFLLILFGLICVPLGLFLWHNQSRFFFGIRQNISA